MDRWTMGKSKCHPPTLLERADKKMGQDIKGRDRETPIKPPLLHFVECYGLFKKQKTKTDLAIKHHTSSARQDT